MTHLGEETNDDVVFNLVVGGRAQTYATRVEKYMWGGIERPSDQSKILGPADGIINVTNVVALWMMNLSITWMIDHTWGMVVEKKTQKLCKCVQRKT